MDRLLNTLATLLLLTSSQLSYSQTYVSQGSGSWTSPISMAAIPVSAANLPDGRILTWSAYNASTYQPYGQDFGRTFTSIFNPVTLQSDLTLVSNTQHDMFCPGANVLADGSVLVNGGSSAARTSLFNPVTESWSQDATMNIPRSYNANTLLYDGSVLTLGGSWHQEPGCRAPEQNCPDKTAEVWTAGSGWRVLPNIPANALRTNDEEGLFRSDNHMWLFSVAGGKVLHAGPSKAMHLLDITGNGNISNLGNRANDADAMNGNATMFGIDKILTTGGAPHYENTNATRSAFVIEYDGSTVNTRRIQNMSFARAYHNSVVLPNGEVLIIGGQSYPVPFTETNSVLTPELWNPTTESFRTLAPMTNPRNYHSVALLLPDGRVLAGGGGLCGEGCGANRPDVEIFTPPYLLDSNSNPRNRPVITTSPSTATRGEPIQISTASSIDSAVLMRMAAVTHSVNNAQRRIPLTLTLQSNNQYSAQIPADPGIVTPGNYMLFVLDSNGTPSESSVINIQGTYTPNDSIPPEITINTPATDDAIITPGSYNFSGTSSDSGGSGFRFVRFALNNKTLGQWYNFNTNSFSGAVGNGATSANLTNTSISATDWNYNVTLAAGEYTLAVRTFDNAGNTSPWAFRNFDVQVPDNTKPTTSITNPANNAAVIASGAFNFAGTATDSGGSGFDSVQFAIRNDDINRWYNFSTNAFTSVNVIGAVAANMTATTITSTSWNRSLSLNAGDYTLAARAVDNAGNISAWSFRTLSVQAADNLKPTTAITSPANNGAVIPPGSFNFSGTAADTGGSGFDSVQFGVRNNDVGRWYNFSTNSFNRVNVVAAAANITATTNSSTNWNRAFSLAAGSYTLAVRSVDNAGNLSAWNYRTFTVQVTDNLKPTTTITNPANNGAVIAPGIFNFTGTAADAGGSGFDSVQFAVRDNTISRWYNFATNAFTGVNVVGAIAVPKTATTTSSTNWNRTFSLTPGNYTIAVRSIDNAGNISAWAFRKFSVQSPDSIDPTLSISSPATEGAVIGSGNFTYSGTASDTGGSGFQSVQVAIRSRTLGQWYNFSNSSFSGAVGNGATSATLSNQSTTSTDWNLTASLNPGSYTIAVRVFDAAGNSSGWSLRKYQAQ